MLSCYLPRIRELYIYTHICYALKTYRRKPLNAIIKMCATVVTRGIARRVSVARRFPVFPVFFRLTKLNCPDKS